MRKIKFRAWDKIDLDMSFDEIPGDCLIEKEMNNDDLIIMQFTGLRDKNDKEIYEGDILMDESDNHPCFIVKYLLDDEHSCFALFNWVTDNPRDKWWWFENYSPHYMEVIGNIYENPELLKC